MGDEKGKDPWPELRLLPMGRRIQLEDGHGGTWVGTVVPNHGFTVALSRKNNSVYRPGLMIERRLPRNSRTQTIHRLQAKARRMCWWLSCRQPRLPMRVPRDGVAISSPNGVTRFCRGMP